MKTLNQHIITCFLILAFITAGISPACHFVNGGKALIEICKADGSIETIEVDPDLSPFETADTQPKEHEEKDECMFCYATGKQTADKTPAPQLIAAIPAQYLSNAGGLITPKSLDTRVYPPTGPPVPVV